MNEVATATDNSMVAIVLGLVIVGFIAYRIFFKGKDKKPGGGGSGGGGGGKPPTHQK